MPQRTAEQELAHRNALKMARFWQSQGEYHWAENWKERARTPKAGRVYTNNPDQKLVSTTKKRPSQFQGATVGGLGDPLLGIQSHKYRSAKERALSGITTRWYWDDELQSCREYGVGYYPIEPVVKQDEFVLEESTHTQSFAEAWAEVSDDETR